MRFQAIKITWCIFVSLVVTLSAVKGLPLQDKATSTIDNYIERQAQRQRGEEYREARKVTVGDLTNDGVAETVVLYTIEGQSGSNNFVQYLAVFTRGKGGLVALTNTPVGG